MDLFSEPADGKIALGPTFDVDGVADRRSFPSAPRFSTLLLSVTPLPATVTKVLAGAIHCETKEDEEEQPCKSHVDSGYVHFEHVQPAGLVGDHLVVDTVVVGIGVRRCPSAAMVAHDC